MAHSPLPSNSQSLKITRYPSGFRSSKNITNLSNTTSSGFGGGGEHSRISMSTSASMESLHFLMESEVAEVKNVLVGRERNKKQMRDLNERLANHVEKSRFLTAHNRKLADELTSLKAQWIQEADKMKAMFERQLERLRIQSDESERVKVKKDSRIDLLQTQLNQEEEKNRELTEHNILLQESLEKHLRRVGDMDNEINVLKRKIESCEEERRRDRNHINTLKAENGQLFMEVDGERMQRAGLESRLDASRNDLEFIKEGHLQEIKQLKLLIPQDNDEKTKEFWRNELSQALRDIEDVYDRKYDNEKADMEEKMMAKLREIATRRKNNHSDMAPLQAENNRLKDNIQELRNKISEMQRNFSNLQNDFNDEKVYYTDDRQKLMQENEELKSEYGTMQTDLEKALAELKTITNTKLDLEAEIETYKSLLDLEDNGSSRIISVERGSFRNKSSGARVKPSSANVEDMLNGHDVESPIVPVKARLMAKSQYDKNYVGPLYIEECSSDGRFVEIGNSSETIQNLENWRIIRNVDNGKLLVRFTFPEGQVSPGKTIKIWARGTKPSNAKSDISCPYVSWGIGEIIESVLYDPNGDERARHTQRTAYPD